ncbi:hypothetical protein GCM10027049_02100 [Mucilaginibacter puniceus]
MEVIILEEKILYDYRYEDSVATSEYQIVLPKAAPTPTNTDLFIKLYELLVDVFEAHQINVSAYYLSPVLRHQYESCKYSKFAFVTGFATAYRQLLKNGQLRIIEVNQYIDHWLNLHERNSVIYEGTVRVAAVADEETARRMDVPVGTPYTYIPEPKSPKEAFQRLKFLMAQQMAEHYISEFERLHAEPTAEVFFSEISQLDKFIASIDHDQMESAFKCEDSDWKHEYLRITMGYYDTHFANMAMGSTVSQVYGKYFHYKRWLENKMRESFVPKANGLPSLDLGQFNDSSLISRELFEKLFKRSRLSDFFRVPAPRHKGRFWYDINDKDTDKPEKVVRVSEISIAQTRRATEADFPQILKRISAGHDPESGGYSYFLNDVYEHVAQMKAFHQDLHQSHERAADHYQLLNLADHFVEWLKQNGGKIPVLPPTRKQGKPKRPSQIVIALLYLYKREVIVTRTNADEIGKAYGHNTGGKIYNFFSRYSTRNKLVGAELTDTINYNKLKNFEQVIVLLQDFPDALSRAKTDMAEFKRNAGFD